ncbi:MAG: Lrp/AsnC family transcriptional regulator [Haloarculaceae archaeon]
MSPDPLDLDGVDATLLDAYQSGLPVRERPFDRVADELGVTPGEVLDRLRAHDRSGLVRRVGPVLDPSVIGSSTLAALRVPDAAVGEAAAVVSEYTEVSHNYRRDHKWNVWFVLTARSRERRDAVLDEIGERTGHDPLSLPKRTQYCLDLQFPVAGDRAREGAATTAGGTEPRIPEAETDRGRTGTDAPLHSAEAAVLDAIQDGLPPSRTPYADVAADLGLAVSTVLETVSRLLATGHVKRVGVVVNHHAAGFRDNCMLVWDVPDGELDAVGTDFGNRHYVTKCYHRPRRPDRGWPYNLFTMIHARDADDLDGWIDEMAADYPHPHERLETVERFKQTGTRYDVLLPDADE